MDTYRRFRTVGILALILAFASALSAKAQPTGCRRVALTDSRPQWISSATFIDQGSRIALVDPLLHKLLLVNSRGKSSEAQWDQANGQNEPAFINRALNGYVLSMIDRRLFWLDSRLKPRPMTSLTKRSNGSQGSIESAYDSVSSGDFLYYFGAMRTVQGQFWWGFFRTPLEAPAVLESLFDFKDVDYYLLGHKYLTGLAGDGYAVVMTEKPSIFKFPRTGKQRIAQLKSFPEEYRRAPKLRTASTGSKSQEAPFKEIEGLTIPVGLYGQDGLLYLLTRKPRARGGATWLLHKIDPKSDRVLGQSQLPTTAKHLTVVNTGDNWYVFEKGSVQPDGSQKIDSMLIIPNSVIKSLKVPEICSSR